jgi:hypothetical protein
MSSDAHAKHLLLKIQVFPLLVKLRFLLFKLAFHILTIEAFHEFVEAGMNVRVEFLATDTVRMHLRFGAWD